MEMMCDRIAIIQKGKLINIQNVSSDETESDKKTYFCDVDNRNKAIKVLSKTASRL